MEHELLATENTLNKIIDKAQHQMNNHNIADLKFTLPALEDALDEFETAHQSYVLTLEDGDSIDVAEQYYSDVFKKYIDNKGKFMQFISHPNTTTQVTSSPSVYIETEHTIVNSLMFQHYPSMLRPLEAESVAVDDSPTSRNALVYTNINQITDQSLSDLTSVLTSDLTSDLTSIVSSEERLDRSLVVDISDDIPGSSPPEDVSITGMCDRCSEVCTDHFELPASCNNHDEVIPDNNFHLVESLLSQNYMMSLHDTEIRRMASTVYVPAKDCTSGDCFYSPRHDTTVKKSKMVNNSMVNHDDSNNRLSNPPRWQHDPGPDISANHPSLQKFLSKDQGQGAMTRRSFLHAPLSGTSSFPKCSFSVHNISYQYTHPSTHGIEMIY